MFIAYLPQNIIHAKFWKIGYLQKNPLRVYYANLARGHRAFY